MNSVTLTGPSAQEISTETIQAPCAQKVSTSSTPQTQNPKTKQTTVIPNAKEITRGEGISSWNKLQGRGESRNWVPKHSNLQLRKANPTPQSRQPWQHQATNGFQKTTLRWVPKKVLQGQGYYTGTKQIWIPKKLQTPSFPTTTNSPIQGVRTCVPQWSTPNSTPIQRWVVRADYNKKKYKANEESLQQVFKSPTQLRLHEPTINPLNSNKSRAVPQFKPFIALTIQEKATYLQALLSHTAPHLPSRGTPLPPIITLPRGTTSYSPTFTVKSPVIGLQA